jgi:hypothetical protein
VEALLGRLVGRGNGGVQSNVQVSTLQFVHHQVWLIGETDIQVTQQNYVDMFDPDGLLLLSKQHWAQHRAERDPHCRSHWRRHSLGIPLHDWRKRYAVR